MNRRHFLRALTTLTAAAIAAPSEAVERLLAPRRTYFDLGERPHLNTLVTPDWVIREVTKQLVQNLRMAEHVNRRYDEHYAVVGSTIGATVLAKLPQRYREVGVAVDGWTAEADRLLKKGDVIQIQGVYSTNFEVD